MKSLITMFTTFGMLVGFMGGVIFWSSAAEADVISTDAGVGCLAGGAAGAKIGAGFGVATAGWGMAATVPAAIGGCAIGAVAGALVDDTNYFERQRNKLYKWWNEE